MHTLDQMRPSGLRRCLPKIRIYDIIDIKYIIRGFENGLAGVDQGG